MNNQKELPRRKSRDNLDLSSLPVLRQGIAREITIVVRSNFERQVVHRITEFEELYVGLNPQAESRGGSFIQIFQLKSGFGLAIECLDVRPFQADHVQPESLLAACPLGIPPQPRFEPRPQIPQRKRTRRALREIGSAHVVKSPLAQNGAQAWEVFGHAAENAKPILPIVDFQAFEGGQTIIRFDVAGRVVAHTTSAGRRALHVLRPRQWLHYSTSDCSLKRDELHTATARAVSGRKRLALRASL